MKPTVTIGDDRLYRVFAQDVEPAVPALFEAIGADPDDEARTLFDTALRAMFLVGAREAMVELAATLYEQNVAPDFDVEFAGDLRFDGSELKRLLEGRGYG
jgi:hypothetical protein